ncbi:MAG: ABC transporter permease [Nocardioidaceae bacterium]
MPKHTLQQPEHISKKDGGPAVQTGEGNPIASAARGLLLWQEIGIFVIAVGLVCYFAFSNGAFISGANLVTLSQTVAPVAIMALGLVMVMILGEIDLSVGSTFGFAPAVMWLAYDELRLVMPVAVLVALAVTGLVGLVNGVVRVYFGVPSFVVTIGTFFLLGGLTVIILSGFPVNAPPGAAQVILGGYPYAEILWAVGLLVVMHLLLKHTRWGLHTFATGDNFVGAAEAGIKVDRVRIVNFVICAVLAGLAGILEAMRIGSIDPLAGGANTMLFAIAAAIIGGTPLSGGVGTMIGAFLGAVVYSELKQGFTLLGVNANTFQVILGVAILLIMVLNVYVTVARGRSGLGRARRSRGADHSPERTSARDERGDTTGSGRAESGEHPKEFRLGHGSH